MKKMALGMIALGAVVGWVRGADAAATFFVAPNPYSQQI